MTPITKIIGKISTLKIVIFIYFLISFAPLKSQVCDKWIAGYVPTYTQAAFGGSIHYLTAAEYAKMTHVIHMGPYVNANGSLNMSANGATNIRMEQAVLEVHNNNKPIILAFQGWHDTYMPAISNPTTRAALINNVLNLFDTYGYDGIDVDLEPVMSPWVAGMQTGNPAYVDFINILYDSLQTRTSAFTNKKPLLTVAANGFAGPVLNQLQAKFDMINIMTYDLAGVFPGWVPWHDSAVFDGGNTNPYTGQYMTSVNAELLMCINAGVAPPKLGVGVSMDAFRWRGGDGTATGGVTAPMQQYTTDPTWTRFSYFDFITNQYNDGTYHYDNAARMSYYSKDRPGSADDEFWSFNDQTSIEDKVDYVWDNILGGTMIWELHSGYFSSNPATSKIPQLNYIYDQNCLRSDPCPDPYLLCPGESYNLTANGATTGIQWYKDGLAIPAPEGTNALLVVTEIGNYTWAATDNQGCDINNCCSIHIIEGNCCSISQTHTAPMCNNNGTGGNAADDFISFSVTGTVTSGSGNYVVKIGAWTSASTPSGTALMITGNGQGTNPNLQANGIATYTVRVEDAVTGTCFTEFVVGPVASCPCSVVVSASPSICTPATNTYSVSGNVTFSEAPVTGSLTVSIGAATETFDAPFTSPQAYTLTGLTAAGGSQTVTAVFSGDATCIDTETYTAPASCAPICSISQTHTAPMCNNNGTGGNAADDFISFSVTGTVTSGSGNYVVKIGAWTSPSTPSGTALMITGNGQGTNPNLQANGIATYTVRVEDAVTGTCFTEFVAGAVVSCPCSVVVSASPSICTSATNTYSVSGNVTFSEAPVTGSLTVSIGAASETFDAPFTSPQAYTLTGLTAAGGSQTVTAVFSGDATCTDSETYTAPASCAPICGVSQTHTASVCNHNNTGGISTDDYFSFSVTGTVTSGSGNYVVKIGAWTSPSIVSGQAVSIVGNGIGGNPTLPANNTNIVVRIEDSVSSTCFTVFNAISTSCSTCPTLNCGTVTVQKN